MVLEQKNSLRGIAARIINDRMSNTAHIPQIPNEVLTKIVEHRQHLKSLAEHGEHVHLARNYMMGESRLTMHETDRLAAVAAVKAW